MSTDKRLEILYAHYNDVVANRRTQIRSRYRYLLFILIVVVLVLLQRVHPTLVLSIFAGLAERFLNADIAAETLVFETILPFIYMVLIVRYLQIAVSTERSYNETNFLEDKISKEFGVPIKTEGEAYLEDYPLIQDAFDILYKFVIPALFLSIAGIHIAPRFPITLEVDNLFEIVDVGFVVVIFVFILLYWWFTYKESIAKVWSKIRRSRTETAQVSEEQESSHH